MGGELIFSGEVYELLKNGVTKVVLVVIISKNSAARAFNYSSFLYILTKRYNYKHLNIII